MKPILIGVGVVVASGAAFLAIFPLVSQAKMSGKPSKEKQAQMQTLGERRQKEFVIPISQAIAKGDGKSVQSLWLAYEGRQSDFGVLWEDPELRLKLAKYWESAGELEAAKKQVDLVLHPGKGHWSTLMDSGDAKALAARIESRMSGDPTQKKLSATERTDLAQIEFQAAQELSAQDRMAEASAHYEKAVRLNPGDPYLWLGLKRCRYSLGNIEGAKQAALSAYRAAPREEIRIKADLTPEEVGVNEDKVSPYLPVGLRKRAGQANGEAPLGTSR